MNKIVNKNLRRILFTGEEGFVKIFLFFIWRWVLRYILCVVWLCFLNESPVIGKKKKVVKNNLYS